MAMSQKDLLQKEAILQARTKQVLESLAETYGLVTIEVMFLAVSRWFGTFIYNSTNNPAGRREMLQNFVKQIEGVITGFEKGNPWSGSA